MPLARRYWLSPIGATKSSCSTSPGWIGSNTFLPTMPSLVIVHDFDLVGVPLAPHEADPPPIIDPDAVLAPAGVGAPPYNVRLPARTGLWSVPAARLSPSAVLVRLKLRGCWPAGRESCPGPMSTWRS